MMANSAATNSPFTRIRTRMTNAVPTSAHGLRCGGRCIFRPAARDDPAHGRWTHVGDGHVYAFDIDLLAFDGQPPERRDDVTSDGRRRALPARLEPMLDLIPPQRSGQA